MTDQPTLFDQPELLPTLPGMIQGVVGVREGAGKRGRNEYDLQCQDCLNVETVDYLVLMRYQFPRCQTPRRRLCPDCHKKVCDGYGRCRGLPGMPGFYICDHPELLTKDNQCLLCLELAGQLDLLGEIQ